MFGITAIHTSLVTPLWCCLVISVLCFIRTGQIASGIYHPQWKWESEGKSLWHTMHHLNVCWLSPMKKTKQTKKHCHVPNVLHHAGTFAPVLLINWQTWLMNWTHCNTANLALKSLSTVRICIFCVVTQISASLVHCKDYHLTICWSTTHKAYSKNLMHILLYLIAFYCMQTLQWSHYLMIHQVLRLQFYLFWYIT